MQATRHRWKPFGNVLQLGFAQGHYRTQIHLLGHIPIDHVRNADRVGLGEVLQPGGDVDPIAKHIAVFLHNVTEMNTNADVNLLGFLLLGVVRPQLALNRLRTLHSVDDGGEVHEKRITDSFDDMTVMNTHCLLDNLIVNLQQPQHPRFVRSHLTTKADDVREHDGRQATTFDLPCLVRFHAHGGDYAARPSPLSNGAAGIWRVVNVGQWMFASCV